MRRCTRCSAEFVLFAAFGGLWPEGLTFDGAPYCWECFQEVAREIERAARPKTAVSQGVSQ